MGSMKVRMVSPGISKDCEKLQAISIREIHTFLKWQSVFKSA